MMFGSVLAHIPAGRWAASAVAETAPTTPPPATAQSSELPQEPNQGAPTDGSLGAPWREVSKPKTKSSRHKKQVARTTVLASSFAPTRSLFLEMAEKLQAIGEHRLRMSGWYDQQEDEELEYFYVWDNRSTVADDGIEDDDEEELEDFSAWDDRSTVADDGIDDDEEEGGCYLGVDGMDEMEGEERKISNARADEDSESEAGSDTESDAESECVEEPSEDAFTWRPLDWGMEYETTRGILSVAAFADHYANLVLQTTSEGLLLSYGHGVQSGTASGIWNHCKRMYCSWIRSLHAGCDYRLEYNPLMTAVFEMVVGWNIRMALGPKLKKRGYEFEAALDIAFLQEVAAAEKQTELLKQMLLLGTEDETDVHFE
ncbi:uncharacterized protein RCC_08851 [Ramularia collo-cygni]|uniref:Uncharacterized protein n=1 Tax=Ramularia collo-cygni TaxID=112498 RepID=A0A2D3VG79_9PEZI|nr:uncharacterized protein RCC_08851 [Ramularia collo-cygni]CZT23141.1 uncharacterized protein RCC_08851 [Ramularia collo-cygni]